MIPKGYDVFFDGLPGPTHNFGGLSVDNIASQRSVGRIANPKAAALQVLDKMMLLAGISGVRQAVLPPHERPHLLTLRNLGFRGPDRTLPEKANALFPELLPIISSAAAMYAANAASITPSIDSFDGKVHITVSNMAQTDHRKLEPAFNAKLFKLLFPSSLYFVHHPPLPFESLFSDEGSANRCHFSRANNRTGIHLFVYGDSARSPTPGYEEEVFYRQSREASETIARSHHIPRERTIVAQQSPAALFNGAFHNDLVATSCRTLFFYHEYAFNFEELVIDDLREKIEKYCDTSPHIIQVPEDSIPIKTAINTYLFNSQIVEIDEGLFSLIAPKECQTHPIVFEYLDKLTKNPRHPIRDVHFVDLHESMRNGGGPACLSLRASLTENELAAIHPGVFLTERLYNRLVEWVNKHYRDQLEPADLVDPNLVDETQTALEELTHILDLGKLYDFQG